MFDACDHFFSKAASVPATPRGTPERFRLKTVGKFNGNVAGRLCVRIVADVDRFRGSLLFHTRPATGGRIFGSESLVIVNIGDGDRFYL